MSSKEEKRLPDPHLAGWPEVHVQYTFWEVRPHSGKEDPSSGWIPLWSQLQQLSRSHSSPVPFW